LVALGFSLGLQACHFVLILNEQGRERAREKRMKYAKTAEKVAGPEENQLKDWA